MYVPTINLINILSHLDIHASQDITVPVYTKAYLFCLCIWKSHFAEIEPNGYLGRLFVQNCSSHRQMPLQCLVLLTAAVRR